MRKILVALSAAAFAAGIAATSVPAEARKAPAKTTLGCVKGKEKWNATLGKCEKKAKKAVKKAKKGKAKAKAPAKKKKK